MNKEIYNIKLTENTKIIFPNDKPGNVFICGFIDGMFGEYDETFKCFGYCDEVAENNIQLLIDTIKNGSEVRVLGTDLVVEYMNNVIRDLVDGGVFARKDIKNVHFCSCGAPATMEEYSDAVAEKFDKIYEYIKRNGMKFDYIIQNPPYKGSLHLDFLEKGLDLLTENGKMVIIEPARWLIDLCPSSTYNNGTKANHTPQIKEHIEKHVESVRIENLNKDFGIANTLPFAITTIDMSKTFDYINYTCCGVFKKVNSIYDCNHIGDISVVSSIFKKIEKAEKVRKHVISKQFNDSSIYYMQISDIVWAVSGLYHQRRDFCLSDSAYFSTSHGDFFQSFIAPCMHISRNEVTNIIPKKAARGGSTSAKVKLTDNPANCVYGTKDEIENYKHYISTNSLPLFLNICLSIDQNNNSLNYVPWIVDKQYTDEEINEMFGFTDEEIELINKTIKKYERNSPWFKRYMCGPDSVSDEEVNNFIESL